MAKIKVTRKSYIRKDGTHVKGTTYLTEDKGKSGKTPESEKFFHPNVKMNWHKYLPADVRRANALKAHGGDGTNHCQGFARIIQRDHGRRNKKVDQRRRRLFLLKASIEIRINFKPRGCHTAKVFFMLEIS